MLHTLKPKYFKEELLFSTLNIANDKPEVKKILNTSVHSQVESIKLIKTYAGLSNEGVYKSGLELLVNLKFMEDIKYISNDILQKVHTIYNEYLKSIFVVLPLEINNIPVPTLVNKDSLCVNTYIEGVIMKEVSSTVINKYIMLFLDIKYNLIINA